MSVRITKAFPCVPSGAVHARQFVVGEITDDPEVIAVALRNGWGERPGSDRDAATATASAAASAASTNTNAPPSADPPPRRKARVAAPENK
jgi:hypothetical protein